MLGAKVDLGGGWVLGGTFTTPSIHVFDTARVRVTRGSSDPSSGMSAFTVREIDNVDADTKLGAQLRVGVAYIRPGSLTFVADVVAIAPARYTLFTISPEHRDVRDAITLVEDIERDPVVNLNVGAEYLVSKPFSISGGLFTNFSSAPQIPGELGARFNEGRLPYVNAFGGSFVLGFFGEHTLTRAGITMSYGDGSDVVPRYAGLASLGQQTQWTKVDFKQLFLFFFISSTFRY
jgi:hypothetical protein